MRMPHISRILLGGVVLVMACALQSCDRTDPKKSDSKDRKPMLIHWADDIIIPSYESFRTQLDALVEATHIFSASPAPNTLADLRAAWQAAYIGWEKVEMFEFGPADKYTLRNFYNIYPANVEAISQNIMNPSANLDVPAAYPTQGFPALDYLINGVSDTDAGIVEFYAAAAEGQSRIQYLSLLVTRMSDRLDNVIAEWQTYRDIFVSNTGLDVGSSTGLVVNAYVLHYERFIRSGKFGIPSGAMTTTGGTRFPERVEAVYKRDISLTLARTAHQAVIDFFNGKSFDSAENGPSFKSYLDALDARDMISGELLSEIIGGQLDIAHHSMDPVSEDLYDEVVNNNDHMIAVFREMQVATRMLKVDMTSAMSITITYTDNDGD